MKSENMKSEILKSEIQKSEVLKSEVLKLAKECGADLMGVAPASRFPSNHKIFRIYPDVKSVIGFVLMKKGVWVHNIIAENGAREAAC